MLLVILLLEPLVAGDCAEPGKQARTYTVSGKTRNERVKAEMSTPTRLSKPLTRTTCLNPILIEFYEEDNGDIFFESDHPFEIFYSDSISENYGRRTNWFTGDWYLYARHRWNKDWKCGGPSENYRCRLVREGTLAWTGVYVVTFTDDVGPGVDEMLDGWYYLDATSSESDASAYSLIGTNASNSLVVQGLALVGVFSTLYLLWKTAKTKMGYDSIQVVMEV